MKHDEKWVEPDVAIIPRDRLRIVILMLRTSEVWRELSPSRGELHEKLMNELHEMITYLETL